MEFHENTWVFPWHFLDSNCRRYLVFGTELWYCWLLLPMYLHYIPTQWLAQYPYFSTYLTSMFFPCLILGMFALRKVCQKPGPPSIWSEIFEFSWNIFQNQPIDSVHCWLSSCWLCFISYSGYYLPKKYPVKYWLSLFRPGISDNPYIYIICNIIYTHNPEIKKIQNGFNLPLNFRLGFYFFFPVYPILRNGFVWT